MMNKFSFAEVSAAAETPAQVFVPASANVRAVDAEIATARSAFERRDAKTLEGIRSRIATSGHPLLPYVTYWWLSSSMSQSSIAAITQASDITAFLDANPDAIAAEDLRRDWLKVLGGQDAWEQFAPAATKYTGEDATIICHQWRHRLSRDDRDVLTEIKATFITGKNSNDSCYDAYDAAQKLGSLGDDEVWNRVRRLLENNQLSDARRTVRLLTKPSSRFDSALTAATTNPTKYLTGRKVDARARDDLEVFLFAVTRLARSDAPRAAALLAPLATSLTSQLQNYAWAQVGLYGAMQHEPDAMAWFKKSQGKKQGGELSDTQAAWKARAALRAADWPSVRDAIEAMSAVERRESAWRYWQARALAETGNLEAAKPIRETLARELGFYPLLAAEDLGITAPPKWQGYKPTRAELDSAFANPNMQRVLALYRVDMKAEGFREWQHGVRGMTDQQLLAAAEVAYQAGIPDRAIGAAVRTVAIHDFSQRFPTPHRADLQANASARGLDPAWMYGVIRQESRFIADVRSRAGAMGLMQLMPATAKWAAERVGMKNLNLARVTDVPVNLNLGAYYLRHVLDDLGHPVLATAAYNAGPSRAKRWRAAEALEGAIYAESIPFNETRDYVKQVMTNAWYYAQQFGTGKASLKAMMGKVPSRAGGAGDARESAFGADPAMVSAVTLEQGTTSANQ